MPNLNLAWTVTTMDVESGGSPWDFYLAFIDTPEGLIARAQFNPDLFDSKTVGCVLQDLLDVLENASLESIVTSARISAHKASATTRARATTIITSSRTKPTPPSQTATYSP